jgi:hypothetical protein
MHDMELAETLVYCGHRTKHEIASNPAACYRFCVAQAAGVSSPSGWILTSAKPDRTAARYLRPESGVCC